MEGRCKSETEVVKVRPRTRAEAKATAVEEDHDRDGTVRDENRLVETEVKVVWFVIDRVFEENGFVVSEWDLLSDKVNALGSQNGAVAQELKQTHAVFCHLWLLFS